MKRILLYWFLGLATATPSFSAGPNLWDELTEVMVARLKRDGPDADAAQFISMAQEHAWDRRQQVVTLVTPFLTNQSPAKVGGALEVLYRVRCYVPMGSFLGSFESNSAPFFADLDQQVYRKFEYFDKLKNDRVYQALALYLGFSRTPQAKRELLAIARSPYAKGAKEQALICLAWHRDPADMDALLPFMLEDSEAARSLPYHFRSSYGKAAVPSLLKAMKEAKNETVREEAALELALSGNGQGFDCLRETVLTNASSLDRITQWASDYFFLKRTPATKEEVAQQLEKQKRWRTSGPE